MALPSNMIEPRFGLKFPMPHTLVHIVDNSAYTGDLPTTIAEDPSMLTTLIVTGTPMGVDNRVVPINRTDILRVAYGLSGNPADNSINFQKFGQSIDYPVSIIEQGAPLRMLRVTPEGSTFGVSIVVIQWRREYDLNTDLPKLVVRFRKQEWPRELRLDRFQNPEKVNDALIRILERNDVKPEDNGDPWKQRAFINNISAGRGLAYNNFATCINPVVQGRRPRNIRYNFLTIDTMTGGYVEKMTASLVNINQNDHPDAIDTVNVQVMNRIEASSIIMPFVNESAVHEVFGEWLSIFDENLADEHILHPEDHFVIRRVMNVNIFDILYGNYIWNGNQGDLKLPYYHVDQLRLDIPHLELNHRLTTTQTKPIKFDWESPDALYDRVEPELTGITRTGDNVYVGDLFLDVRRGGRDPSLVMVSAINQISGAVTPLRIPEVFVLVDPNDASDPFGTNPESAPIKFAYNQEVDLLNAIREEIVVNGDIVAKTNGNVFELQVINNIINPKPGTPSYKSLIYNTSSLVYRALNFGAIYNIDIGNMIGRWSNDPKLVDLNDPDVALSRIGATVIDMDEGKIYVNGFKYGIDLTPNSTDPKELAMSNFTIPNRLPINMKLSENSTTNDRNPLRVGRIPQDITVMKDFAGTNFDVLIYPDEALENATYTITNFNPATDIVNGGKGYSVEDVLRIKEGSSDPVTISLFTVTRVTDTEYKFIDNTNPGKEIWNRDKDFDTLPGNDNIEKVLVSPKEWLFTDDDDNDNEVWKDEENPIGNFTPVMVDGVQTTRGGNQEVRGGEILSLKRRNANAREAVSMIDLSTIPGTPVDHDLVYQSTDTGGTGAVINIKKQRVNYPGLPKEIIRYVVSGALGSIYRISRNPVDVPNNYYDALLGLNMRSETGGVRIEEGSTGFFDDRNMNSIVFKWRYSELLVRAFRGEIDPRIKSPTRVPAFFLFDGGYNTIVGTTIQPELSYPVSDIIEASTIFTEDEQILALERPTVIAPIIRYEDIDVKQAMFDLMEYRVYQGIPDEYRPIGPGSGLSLFLDAGTNCDASMAEKCQKSFARRFNNPNCSWDIGGWVDRPSGQNVTFVKQIADNLFRHIRSTTINKPYVMQSSMIAKKQYNVFFPDMDEVDWKKREERYNSGGNVWYPDTNNNLLRRSQRTVFKDAETSDFVQESNMRTLTRMIFMAQTHINSYLLEYSDDGTLKTLEDELNNMFSLWPGRLLERFKIKFERKLNIDGGEIVVCQFDVWFRGLILRVPIIVNVNRRDS